MGKENWIEYETDANKNAKTKVEKTNIDVNSLNKIAIYLEGVKQGRGGVLSPLGTNDLEQLWNAIQYLNGDERFKCEKL